LPSRADQPIPPYGLTDNCGGYRLIHCAGRQNSQPVISQRKLDRATSHQFTVQFYRDILIAADAQMLGLKIFDFWNSNIGAEKYFLQVFDDVEIADLLERDNIEQPVVQQRMFEEREWTAIAPTVADQHEGSFTNRCIG